MLKDILILVAHWYHVAGFLIGGALIFRSGWNQLAATEQLVRQAALLSLDNPKRADAVNAIKKAQKKAIFKMRLCLVCAVGLIWIVTR